jgi:hypothetical protein
MRHTLEIEHTTRHGCETHRGKSDAVRLAPPKKLTGLPTGPRRLNGAVMDVASIAAKYYGGTEKKSAEKKVRADVARRLLPHRRLGGRIIFIDQEIEEFFKRLPGVSVSEALANQAARRSGETHSVKQEDAAEA